MFTIGNLICAFLFGMGMGIILEKFLTTPKPQRDSRGRFVK